MSDKCFLYFNVNKRISPSLKRNVKKKSRKTPLSANFNYFFFVCLFFNENLYESKHLYNLKNV